MRRIIQKSSLLLLIAVTPVVLLSFGNVYAVDLFSSNVCKGSAADSAACKDSVAGADKNPLYGPDGVITVAINLMSVIVGIAAVIVVLLAGLKFITSGSNPQDVTKAREMVLYAAVGLFVAAFAQVLVRFFLSRL